MNKSRLGSTYWKLFTSFLFSNLGGGITLVLIPLLSSQSTSSPFLISLIEMFRQLPWLLFALPVGVLVDRFDKKNLAGISNLLKFILISLLVYSIFAQSYPVYKLIILGFLLGSLDVVYNTSVPSLIPSIVPSENLNEVNGQILTLETICNYFLGRVFGAFLSTIPILSASIAAIFYLTSSFIFKKTHIPPEKKNFSPITFSNFMREIHEGFNYIYKNSVLKILAILGLLGNTAFGAILGTLVLYIKEINGTNISFGAVYGSFAIGATIAGTQVNKITQRFGNYKCLYFSILMITTSFFLIPIIPSVFWVGSLFFVNGVSATIWNTVSISYRQTVTPINLIGRATSFFRLVSWGGMPIGSLLGGITAEYLGLRAPYLIFGLFPLFCTFLISKFLSVEQLDI